jgi:protein O-mannosyl-transferase
MSAATSFFNFPERLHSWQKLLPYAVLLSVTAAVYGATLYYRFVWDDIYYIGRNFRVQELSLERLGVIWSTTHLGHYAPVHITFLALVHAIAGLNPFGYHLAQLLLHAACLCILYGLLSRMESPRIAFISCLLFAVYPPNIETVAWISESKSTLAFLFFLLSFWFFVRLRETGKYSDGLFCGLFLALSMLSKINTVVAPAVFLLWDYRKGTLTRDRIRSLSAFFLLSAAFVGIHLVSFYGMEVEGASYYGSFWVHVMNLPRVLWFYVRMILFPSPPSAWRMFPVYDAWNWTLIAAWVGLFALLVVLSRGNRVVRFWGLWFLVFLAPVLQLFPFGIWVADRYLYIPAIGAFVLAAMAFFWLLDRIPSVVVLRAAEMTLAGVIMLLGSTARAYVPIWRDNVTLWQATTPGCDTSAYCHVSLGAALIEDGQLERGIPELIRAVELRDATGYLTQLGDAYTLARDFRQAPIAYEAAISKTPAAARAPLYAKLSRAYLIAGDLAQARVALDAGIESSSREPSLWVTKAFLAWKENDAAAARAALEKALQLAGWPPDAGIYVYAIWGDLPQVDQFLRAVRLADDDSLHAP